jgi:hypothetical protein
LALTKTAKLQFSNMKLKPKSLFLLAFFHFACSAFAQYSCNFESGLPDGALFFPAAHFDITNSYAPEGNYSLSHIFDSPESATSFFSAQLPKINPETDQIIWRFRIRYAYSPSKSNNWSFFLLSDNYNGNLDSGNGIAIGVDLNTSDDLVKIWQVKDGKASIIASSKFNWQKEIGTDIAPLLQVVYAPSGKWQIFISATANLSDLKEIGEGSATYSSSAYCWGLRYQYTKNQDRKLWLDDVSINWQQINTIQQLRAKPYAVIFSELMPDPEPSTGLPAYEYVELYNRSSDTISLKKWTLSIGNHSFEFPDCQIKPQSTIIISTKEGADNLSAYGNTLNLFTSKTTLSNSGTTLILRDASGQTIDAAQYVENNLAGSDGGRSLIRQDIQQPCFSLWKLSQNQQGGSPGIIENDTINNFSTIKLLNAFLKDDKTVMLSFNQSLDSLTASDKTNYKIGNGFIINAIKVLPPFFNKVEIALNSSLVPNEIANLEIQKSLCNCTGAVLPEPLKTKIAIPEKPQAGDLIINEFRFDPLPGYPEMIEILNTSNKVLDMGMMQLQTISTSGKTYTTVFPGPQLLFPEEIRAYFSGNDSINCTYDEAICQSWPDMPNFLSKQGVVELNDTSGVLFESIPYEQKWHFSLLTEKRGHSLERLSPQLPAYEESSWQTAADICGTPGKQNSQQLTDNEQKSEIILSEEIFGTSQGLSPTVNIKLNNLHSGGMVTMQIFNLRGGHERWITRNELAGNAFSADWDGRNDSQSALPKGIYIVHVQWITLKGESKTFKKVVVFIP